MKAKIRKGAGLVFVGIGVAIAGCSMNTTKVDTPKQTVTPSLPGSYSLYGKSIQKDEKTDLAYIDVYVGGGGDRDGAAQFASTEIQGYGRTNGFTSHEIVKSEYSFFPLSKYRIFVQYK